jgi:hypothetical protein
MCSGAYVLVIKFLLSLEGRGHEFGIGKERTRFYLGKFRKYGLKWIFFSAKLANQEQVFSSMNLGSYSCGMPNI